MDFFKLLSKENVDKTFYIKFLPGTNNPEFYIDTYSKNIGMKYNKLIYVSNAMVNGEFKQLVFTKGLRDFLQIFFLGTKGYIIQPNITKYETLYSHHRVIDINDIHLDGGEFTYVNLPEYLDPFSFVYSIGDEMHLNPYSFKITVREVTNFNMLRLLDLGKIETVEYEPNMIIKDLSDTSKEKAGEFIKSKPSLEGLAQYYVEAYQRDQLIDEVLKD